MKKLCTWDCRNRKDKVSGCCCLVNVLFCDFMVLRVQAKPGNDKQHWAEWNPLICCFIPSVNALFYFHGD